MEWIDKVTAKIKRRIGIEESDTNYDNLIKDYIEDTFMEIINYTNANSFNKSYEPTLVDCVVALWRRRGVEGANSRSAGGVSESYDSSVVIAPIISSKLPQIIRPLNYSYSSERYEYPKE